MKSEGNLYRPFCSERCKLIDLDNWLSGRYRISSPISRQDTETKERSALDGAEGEID